MNFRKLQPDNFQRKPRGLWIAFFGPDGVGKSAVIERLRNSDLDGAFRGFEQFHFRPRLGLGGRERAPVTAPHAQRPRGVVSSILKLCYWLLDCWLGYLFLVLPALRGPRLVIFDRYLPDLLVDPVRYRLPAAAMKLAAIIVRCAPQPDLCVLLDAPAESVQQRKQEVPLPESRRQRAAYLRLLATLPTALVMDATCPVEEVTQNVATAISQMLHSPSPGCSRLSPCRPSL